MHLFKKSLEGDTFYDYKVIYDLLISLNTYLVYLSFFFCALWGEEIRCVIRPESEDYLVRRVLLRLFDAQLYYNISLANFQEIPALNGIIM